METNEARVSSSLLKRQRKAPLKQALPPLRELGAGCWEWDIRASRVNWTPEIRAIYGIEAQDSFEPSIEAFLKYVHEDDRAQVMATVSETLAQHRPSHEQRFRICRADGTIRHILSRARFELDSDGNPAFLKGIDIDLTSQTEDTAALHSGELRKAYLLRLEESLRTAVSPHEMIMGSCAALGQALGVARVGYGEIEPEGKSVLVEKEWRRSGMPAATGRHFFADYGAERIAPALSGKNVIVADILNHPQTTDPDVQAKFAAFQVQSIVDMPLQRDGSTRALLFVADNVARQWNETDIELIRQTLERTWHAAERIRAETKLRASEEKYRSLFESIDEGFCIVEMLYDAAGEPVDYRFLEVNKVFEQQTGLVNAVGKTARELVPELEQWWIDTYGRVGLTGKNARFEQGSAPMGRFFTVFAVRVGDETSRKVAIVFNDITERKQAENALRQSADRLQLAAEAPGFGVYEHDSTLRQSIWSKEVFGIFGIQPSEHVEVAILIAAIHPDDREDYKRFMEQPVEEENGNIYEHFYRIVRPNGELRWINEKGRVEFSGEGENRREVKTRGTIVDVTQRKQQEEHAEMLMREVNHRAKNLLAVVQAVARQTTTSDPEHFAEHFGQRLSGLAASHDLLVRSEWRGVELGDLIRSQLSHFSGLIGSRIVFEGPQVQITPTAAEAIGMAIHELATNASKHGALSAEAGSVRVCWTLQGTESFTLEWRESGGPSCAHPSHRGFGHTVIVKMVKHALAAEVSLTYPASGLVWQLTAEPGHVLSALPVAG